MSAHEAASAHATHAPGHGSHRNYPKIWGILVVLLAVSVAGPFAGIRVVTLITAFGVALVKAYMVAKNFMHLDVEKPIIRWLMAVALVLMVLMFSGLSPDVMRDRGRNWQKDAGFHPKHAVGHHGAASDSSHGAPRH
jgi:caa(3)-type oxidase subunit IV